MIRTMPRWKRTVLDFHTVTIGWHVERPLRLALDGGDIDINEYDRRRSVFDYGGLPLRCYAWPPR